jgi:hypothetical protein
LSSSGRGSFVVRAIVAWRQALVVVQRWERSLETSVNIL